MMDPSMSRSHHMPILVMIIGIILIGIGVLNGDASFGLFLIIPFVVVHGAIPALGILLFIIGVFLFQFQGVASWGKEEVQRTDGMNQPPNDETYPFPGALFPGDGGEPKVRQLSRRGKGASGIIFIGPIPIIFGDSESVNYLIPAAIVIFFLLIFIGYFF